MNKMLKTAVATAGLVLVGHAAAQITFYEHDNYGGRAFTARSAVENFANNGFNDLASSVVVERDSWEICESASFGGQCRVLQPGRYPSLRQMGMNDRISSVRMIGRSDQVGDSRTAPQTDKERTREAAPTQSRSGKVEPMITFYENDNYGGRTFTTHSEVTNFQRGGFNDRASSVVVQGEGWEVCEAPAYGGRCTVLRPGKYPSLARMGLNDRISSVRTVGGSDRITDDRYAPAPLPAYDARRRNNDRLYQANVSSVRAVVGSKPEERCWIEQQQVAQPQTNNAVPGGIGGAVLGGILGHQVGGGSGRDVATVLGALGGAVVGSQVGKNYGNQPAQTQGVKRCTTTPASTRPDYWDVTYNFRGKDHRVQMATEPGPTITVNQAGEPRS